MRFAATVALLSILAVSTSHARTATTTKVRTAAAIKKARQKKLEVTNNQKKKGKAAESGNSNFIWKLYEAGMLLLPISEKKVSTKSRKQKNSESSYVLYQGRVGPSFPSYHVLYHPLRYILSPEFDKIVRILRKMKRPWYRSLFARPKAPRTPTSQALPPP
jgi:hypothetical protein